MSIESNGHWFNSNGHRWPLRGYQLEPDDAAHCVDCGLVYADYSGLLSPCNAVSRDEKEEKKDIAWALEQMRAGKNVTCKGCTAAYRLCIDDGKEYLERYPDYATKAVLYEATWESKELMSIDFILSDDWRLL